MTPSSVSSESRTVLANGKFRVTAIGLWLDVQLMFVRIRELFREFYPAQ